MAAAENVRRPRRLRRWVRFAIPGVILLALLFVGIRYFHLHSQLPLRLRGCGIGPQWNDAQQWRGHKTIWLPNYEWEIEAQPVQGVRSNLSGLDWAPEHSVLIASVNRPPMLVLLSRDGQTLGRYRLEQTGDTEGIAWMGDGRFAVVQESHGRLHIFRMPPPPWSGAEEDAELHALIPEEMLPLDLPPRHNGGNNNGAEGIAYHSEQDLLYVTMEHSPVGLHSFHGLRTRSAGQPLQRTDIDQWQDSACFMTDLASVEIDPASGHLLLLSEEAQMLLEVTPQGQPVSVRKLTPFAFWQLPPPQPEGVAMDDDGNIYLVSEPDLFYRLKPGGAQH